MKEKRDPKETLSRFCINIQSSYHLTVKDAEITEGPYVVLTVLRFLYNREDLSLYIYFHLRDF